MVPSKAPPIDLASIFNDAPVRETEVVGMPFIPWSGLSIVATRPSSVLTIWNTTRSLTAPVSRDPIHVPSMSDGLAGLCSVFTAEAARLNSSGRAAPCDHVPVMVLASAATLPSYVPWTAATSRSSLESLSVIEHRDAIRAGLVNAVERGLQTPVGRFGDMQHQTEFGAACAECPLPVAGDVLRVSEARREQQSEDQNAFHSIRPSLGRGLRVNSGLLLGGIEFVDGTLQAACGALIHLPYQQEQSSHDQVEQHCRTKTERKWTSEHVARSENNEPGNQRGQIPWPNVFHDIALAFEFAAEKIEARRRSKRRGHVLRRAFAMQLDDDPCEACDKQCVGNAKKNVMSLKKEECESCGSDHRSRILAAVSPHDSALELSGS